MYSLTSDSVVEFSDDGTLLAAVSRLKKCIRLWSIDNAAQVEREDNTSIAPIQMKTKQAAFSLAFAPDNRRLFSGGSDGKILIHIVET